jgi:ribonucrease Y
MNNDLWFYVGLVLVDIFLVAGVTYLVIRSLYAKFRQEQQTKADNVITVAKEDARQLEIEARDRALKLMQDAEADLGRRRMELTREEERLQKRRAELDHRVERLEQREMTLNKRQSAVDKRANEIEKLYTDQYAELQRVAQMTTDEARAELLERTEKESRADMARIIRQIEAEARAEGDKRARDIIADAIQRVASEHVSSITTSVVVLPNEEMKGRIVGRNGRNIRAFEQAAGVDVIVDDTPEAVTISCFDPVRREVARRALDRLILDGRIHPAHIEKILGEEEREVERAVVEAGEQAAFDAGVAGLHPEILRVLGRLRYRTSYGQNQLSHAVEVSRLAAVIASELGANV